MCNRKKFCALVALTALTAILSVPKVWATAQNYEQPVQQMQIDAQQLQRFGLAIAQIKALYVRDVSDEEIFEHAIRGMLSGLDPHSAFLNERDLQAMKTLASGEFSGVGIQIGVEHGILKVISPIDDTPAQKAGIKPGDYILAVDGTSLIDLPINKAVMLMRGQAGSKVTLTIVSATDKKPRRVELTRAKIDVDSVRGELLPYGYGYLRVSHFNGNTVAQAKTIIDRLNAESKGGLNGLVLDLRNNPGGVMPAAVGISDLFLDQTKLGDNSKIVYTEAKTPQGRMVAHAQPGDVLFGAPVVVLINRGSASASEIVAGALQDHKRGIVLGESSFGKGSVQTLLPLSEDSAVKMTTALYHSPAGRSIQAKGIEPDIFMLDVKLPQEAQDEDMLFLQNIRESTLDNHLQAEEKDKAVEAHLQSQKLSATLNKIAHEDYQLYGAINILRSMSLLGDQADT